MIHLPITQPLPAAADLDESLRRKAIAAFYDPGEDTGEDTPTRLRVDHGRTTCCLLGYPLLLDGRDGGGVIGANDWLAATNVPPQDGAQTGSNYTGTHAWRYTWSVIADFDNRTLTRAQAELALGLTPALRP